MCRACCIISDCLYPWTQTLARRLGIPRIGFWTASASSLSVDVSIRLLISHADIPITNANKDKVVDYIPGLTPLKARDLPCMYYSDNCMTVNDPGYVRKMERCDILKDDAWIVVNSFEELESNAFKGLRELTNKRCIGVGPLLPVKYLGFATQDGENGNTSMFEEDTECLQWLDNNKVPNSVIYISFGSLSAFTLSQNDFDELSRGVEESRQLFLWVHDHTKLSEVSMDAFEAFKERTKIKGQGLVIHWAPQMDVLCHPSMGAFLTHCGWNSVLETIYVGVPMLGIPNGAEQTLNCKLFTEHLKIGLPLRDATNGDALTCNGVADKVIRILKDEGMRNRARSFKDAACNAAPITATNIEGLIFYIHQFAKK